MSTGYEKLNNPLNNVATLSVTETAFNGCEEKITNPFCGVSLESLSVIM